MSVINTHYYSLIESLKKGSLHFYSIDPFSITPRGTWDGTLYYSTDRKNWNVCAKGTSYSAALVSGYYHLYFRGENNTKITAGGFSAQWICNATSDIYSEGSLKSLLDWRKSINGQTITPAVEAFFFIFEDWTKLRSFESIDLEVLSVGCCQGMFFGCTSLTTAPKLPATTLTEYCYTQMFFQCTSLTTIPELPATYLPDSCYYRIFYGCSNVKISQTQTGDYTTPYYIGSYSNSDSVDHMFYLTGGTFTGDPSSNTTYYTSNQVV